MPLNSSNIYPTYIKYCIKLLSTNNGVPSTNKEAGN